MLLADTAGLLAAAPEHVPTTSGFDFRYLTPVGDKVFFTADRSPVGRELWVTDGTQAGTRLVKDINPRGSSNPIALTDVDGTLFFIADDSFHGYEVWKSDGTEAGTVLVKDTVPGSIINAMGQPNPEYYVSVTALPGVFLFTSTGNTTSNFRELWRSDGTADGTYRLKEAGEIDDAYWGAQTRDIGPLWHSHGLAYFTGSDPVVGRELWVTDGTVAGTKLLKDIMPGKAWSRAGSVVEGAGGNTYFTARTGGTDAEPVYSMFRTDGTEAGTRAILEGPEFLSGIQFGGSTYFVPSFSHVQPTQLWRTDGTPQGTVKALQFPNNDTSFVNVASVNITGTFRGQLLLYAYTPETGWEYWLSDGTQAGTHTVLETPGPANTQLSQLSVANDQLYFFKDTPGMGLEPYGSDGTPEGTVLLKDIVPGPTSSGVAFPQPFLPVAGGKVVFPAQSAEPTRINVSPGTPGGVWITYYIHDLFVTDGTPAGTQKLETVAPAPPVATVVARHVFYNHSALDGGEGAANSADDAAIAPDKQALLPGQAPSFANVTSFDRGINGIMIDVANLPQGRVLSSDDFDFAGAGAFVSRTIRRGGGENGSDRITLIWRDYNPQDASPLPQAVGNGWLRVTVKATENTGLAQPDVFSFGNLIGETGDGAGAAGWRVSALDLAAVKRALNTDATVTSATDFDRNGRTNALDLAIVRRALNQALPLPPAPAAFADGAAVASVAEELGLVG